MTTPATPTPKRLKIGNHLFESGKEAYASFTVNDNRWFSDARMFCAVNKYGRYFYQLIKENEVLNLVKDNNFNICEVLTSYPKRVYFDVDGTTDASLKELKKVLKQYFGLRKKDYTIAGYENTHKKSYHIVAKKYFIKNEDELKKMKELVSNVKLNGGICSMFDDAVYTKNRNMKCVYQSKPEGTQALPMHPKCEDPMNIKKRIFKYYFINSFIPEETKSYFESGIIPFTSFPPEPEIKKQELQITEQLQIPLTFTDEDLYNAKKLLDMTPSEESQSHGHRWKVGLFCFSNGLTENDFLNWFYKSCPSDRRISKVKKFWDEFKNTDKKFGVSVQNFRLYLSQWYPELANENHNTDMFIKSFNLPIVPQEIERIEPEHFNINKKALVFNIGMGGGKTTTTLQYLKRNEKKSFVWLAPRQTLVLNTSFRMHFEFDIDHINHMQVGANKARLQKAERLLICNQSLFYLTNEQQFDTVVIDEVETVLLSWLDEETHKDNMGANFRRFCHILRNAKKIILLDAFITTKTFNLLKNLGIAPENIQLYTSKYRPAQKKLIVNDKFETILNKIVDDVYHKRKCYIFYPYKNNTEKSHYGIRELDAKIKELVKKRYVDDAKTAEEKVGIYEGGDVCSSLLYFAESKEKNNLGNINELWSDVDYIITTSSITVGVNYEKHDYEKVYLIISGMTNNPRDVIQSSMRIRYPNDTNVEVMFFDVKSKSLKKFPKYYLEEDNVFCSLTIENCREIQADFSDAFFKFCDLTNYNVDTETKELHQKKREKFVNDMFVSKMLMEYSAIKKIDNEDLPDYENKLYNRTASIEERMIIERFYFDVEFRVLDDEIRAMIWNTNARKFFKGITSECLQKIITDNNATSLNDLDASKLTLSDNTIAYIKERYSMTKNKKDWIAREVINSELGFDAIETIRGKNNKNRGYTVSTTAKELNDIYNNKVKLEEEEKQRRIEECQFIEEEMKKEEIRIAEKKEELKTQYTPEYIKFVDDTVKFLEFMIYDPIAYNHFPKEYLIDETDQYMETTTRLNYQVKDFIPNINEIYEAKNLLELE